LEERKHNLKLKKQTKYCNLVQKRVDNLVQYKVDQPFAFFWQYDGREYEAQANNK
jgi:hypothetical protein